MNGGITKVTIFFLAFCLHLRVSIARVPWPWIAPWMCCYMVCALTIRPPGCPTIVIIFILTGDMNVSTKISWRRFLDSSWEIWPKTTNVNRMVELAEKSGINKVSRIHPLATITVCTKLAIVVEPIQSGPKWGYPWNQSASMAKYNTSWTITTSDLTVFQEPF